MSADRMTYQGSKVCRVRGLARTKTFRLPSSGLPFEFINGSRPMTSPWIPETVINWFIRCPKIIVASSAVINNLIFLSILPVFFNFWYWCNFWSSVSTFNKCIYIWSLFRFNKALRVFVINLIAAKKRSYRIFYWIFDFGPSSIFRTGPKSKFEQFRVTHNKKHLLHSIPPPNSIPDQKSYPRVSKISLFLIVQHLIV